jgi:hypothetical protein
MRTLKAEEDNQDNCVGTSELGGNAEKFGGAWTLSDIGRKGASGKGFRPTPIPPFW